MTVEAKICGLSTPETVDAAVAAGAGFVGFVTFPRSPRHIEPLDLLKALGARVPRSVTRVGLFVDPDPGPVLANTGLENLRFLTPLYPGDTMRVELSVRSKSLKSEETGVVRWAVEIFNQKDELVATYDLLTENVP